MKLIIYYRYVSDLYITYIYYYDIIKLKGY